MKMVRLVANSFRNRLFLQPLALRRGCDFGMVPADFRPPFGQGRPAFCAPVATSGRGVGAIFRDLRQLQ